MEFGVALLFLARNRSAGVAGRGGLSTYFKRRVTKPGTNWDVENGVPSWMDYSFPSIIARTSARNAAFPSGVE